MTEERVYKLEDGNEKTLMSTVIYNNIRYLLLLDSNTEEVEVGYEDNGNLIIMDKNEEDYCQILRELYKKLNNTEI